MLACLEAVLLAVAIGGVVVEVVHGHHCVMLRSGILSIEEAVLEGRHIGAGFLHAVEIAPAEAVCVAAALGPQLELLLPLDIVEREGGDGRGAAGTPLNIVQGLETGTVRITYTGAAFSIHEKDFGVAEEEVVGLAPAGVSLDIVGADDSLELENALK